MGYPMKYKPNLGAQSCSHHPCQLKPLGLIPYFRVAPSGTLGLDARVPIPDLFWRVGMCRRLAVEEFRKVYRLLTKYAAAARVFQVECVARRV